MSKWNRKIWAAILVVGMTASLTACGGSKGENSNASAAGTQNETATVQDESTDSNTDSTGSTTSLVQDNRVLQIPDDNYRTYYELFVYSFYDSDGDGIGDLQGVLEKLDYLNDGDDTTDMDLGINGIWLMPVMPSVTYHKYDTTDYENIDPQYGTLETFQELLTACHDRGIRVILDLGPATKGHALILPKDHFANLYELPEEEAKDVIVLAKKMAAKMTEKLGCDGFNLVQNNGEVAGQTVFHFHMHIIPRIKGDTVKVIAGKDKDKEGKVTSIDAKNHKAIVEGVNMITKHTKPSAQNQNGGIVHQEAPIDISNLMYVHNGKTTRVGFKIEGDKKVRIAKSTGEVID